MNDITTARVVGFFTGGPLGLFASTKVMRSLQGNSKKWLIWALVGIPSAYICIAIQKAALVGVILVFAPPEARQQIIQNVYPD
jgi:hypothetical protein